MTKTRTKEAEIEERLEQVSETVSDLSDRAADISKEAIDKSLSFAKEYPLHTAAGVGALGFLAGIITSKILK